MPTRDVISGNKAIAHGVRLARPRIIACYPITPQTTIVNELAEMVAKGELDARFINVESEHSAVTVCTGSELAGARSFTATSSFGLGYMYEGLTILHGIRLPIVIAVANRTLGAPWGGGPDYSDSMSVRDFGFIQFFVEDNQEALDSIIQAYRIAEDERVLLPVIVNIDGYNSSFASEPVSIPDQCEVDEFLPPYRPEHALLDPEKPMAFAMISAIYLEHQIEQAMDRALGVIKEVDEAFGKRFGRSYGVIEEYRTEDAEAVLVTLGSLTGTAREVIDELRKEGKRIGLVKLRTFRPFPTEEFRRIAQNTKILAPVDLNITHGAGGRGIGVVAQEIRGALYGLGDGAYVMGFVAGLGGIPMPEATVRLIAEKALAASRDDRLKKETEWIMPEHRPSIGIFPEKHKHNLILPGGASCAGCVANLVFMRTIEWIGKDMVLIMPPSCMEVTHFSIPACIRTPFYGTIFASTASTSSGVRAGLDAVGKRDNIVVGIAGDGGTADIGLQALSGAAERGDPILYICYDNEAYMNTGAQKSGTTSYRAATKSTPFGPMSRGNLSKGKDVPKIMAVHGIPYVATASAAYLKDYKKKLEKAIRIVKERKGLAYIHVHTPCQAGWQYAADKGIEVARLAVQTGMWKLYEIEEGRYRETITISNPKPVKEYLKLQGRFSHLTEGEIDEIQRSI